MPVENPPILGLGFMIAVGTTHSLFLDSLGNAWGAGSNISGQLGVVTSEQRILSPIQIALPKSIQMLASGSQHSIFLDCDGSVFSAGSNNCGELGLTQEKFSNVAVPQKLDNLPEISSISCGYAHTMLLDTSGKVWTCGKNLHNQLGHKSRKSLHKMRVVEQLPEIKKVCAGFNHSIVIDNQDNVWVFGFNGSGRIGASSKISHCPIKLEGLPPIKAVATGWVHSLFLDFEGKVWGCGSNSVGQLLNKPKVTYNPEKLDNLPIVQEVYAGFYASMFIDIDERVYVCGNNHRGMLGIGDFSTAGVNSLYEVQRPEIVHHAFSDSHSIFVDKSGCTWAVGSNEQGQLGLNDLVSRHTPENVLSLPHLKLPRLVSSVKSARNV